MHLCNNSYSEHKVKQNLKLQRCELPQEKSTSVNEDVERFLKSFVCSLKNPIINQTIGHLSDVFCKYVCLHKSQLLDILDEEWCMELCQFILRKVAEDENFSKRLLLIFTDNSVFIYVQYTLYLCNWSLC